MRTVILAGGYATRLWPLTQDRAKPLLPVAGKPIIEYIFTKLPAELGRPLLSTNARFAPDFKRWGEERGVEFELIVEPTRSEAEKLGTIGALRFLVEERGINEDLLVIGGDNLFEFELQEMIATYHGRPLLALHELKDPERVRGRYGVAVVRDGRIVEFQEKPEEPRSTLVSTACYLYPAEILPLFGEFLAAAPRGHDAPGYFNQWLLTKGLELEAFIFTEPWYDIGDRESYIQANLDYAGTDPVISPDAQIEDSSIRRSVVLAGARVRNSLLEGCVVGEEAELVGVELRDCLIGHRAALRGERERR